MGNLSTTYVVDGIYCSEDDDEASSDESSSSNLISSTVWSIYENGGFQAENTHWMWSLPTLFLELSNALYKLFYFTIEIIVSTYHTIKNYNIDVEPDNVSIDHDNYCSWSELKADSFHDIITSSICDKLTDTFIDYHKEIQQDNRPVQSDSTILDDPHEQLLPSSSSLDTLMLPLDRPSKTYFSPHKDSLRKNERKGHKRDFCNIISDPLQRAFIESISELRDTLLKMSASDTQMSKGSLLDSHQEDFFEKFSESHEQTLKETPSNFDKCFNVHFNRDSSKQKPIPASIDVNLESSKSIYDTKEPIKTRLNDCYSESPEKLHSDVPISLKHCSKNNIQKLSRVILERTSFSLPLSEISSKYIHMENNKDPIKTTLTDVYSEPSTERFHSGVSDSLEHCSKNEIQEIPRVMLEHSSFSLPFSEISSNHIPPKNQFSESYQIYLHKSTCILNSNKMLMQDIVSKPHENYLISMPHDILSEQNNTPHERTALPLNSFPAEITGEISEQDTLSSEHSNVLPSKLIDLHSERNDLTSARNDLAFGKNGLPPQHPEVFPVTAIYPKVLTDMSHKDVGHLSPKEETASSPKDETASSPQDETASSPRNESDSSPRNESDSSSGNESDSSSNAVSVLSLNDLSTKYKTALSPKAVVDLFPKVVADLPHEGLSIEQNLSSPLEVEVDVPLEGKSDFHSEEKVHLSFELKADFPPEGRSGFFPEANGRLSEISYSLHEQMDRIYNPDYIPIETPDVLHELSALSPGPIVLSHKPIVTPNEQDTLPAEAKDTPAELPFRPHGPTDKPRESTDKTYESTDMFYEPLDISVERPEKLPEATDVFPVSLDWSVTGLNSQEAHFEEAPPVYSSSNLIQACEQSNKTVSFLSKAFSESSESPPKHIDTPLHTSHSTSNKSSDSPTSDSSSEITTIYQPIVEKNKSGIKKLNPEGNTSSDILTNCSMSSAIFEIPHKDNSEIKISPVSKLSDTTSFDTLRNVRPHGDSPTINNLKTRCSSEEQHSTSSVNTTGITSSYGSLSKRFRSSLECEASLLGFSPDKLSKSNKKKGFYFPCIGTPDKDGQCYKTRNCSKCSTGLNVSLTELPSAQSNEDPNSQTSFNGNVLFEHYSNTRELSPCSDILSSMCKPTPVHEYSNSITRQPPVKHPPLNGDHKDTTFTSFGDPFPSINSLTLFEKDSCSDNIDEIIKIQSSEGAISLIDKNKSLEESVTCKDKNSTVNEKSLKQQDAYPTCLVSLSKLNTDVNIDEPRSKALPSAIEKQQLLPAAYTPAMNRHLSQINHTLPKPMQTSRVKPLIRYNVRFKILS